MKRPRFEVNGGTAGVYEQLREQAATDELSRVNWLVIAKGAKGKDATVARAIFENRSFADAMVTTCTSAKSLDNIAARLAMMAMRMYELQEKNRVSKLNKLELLEFIGLGRQLGFT